MSEFHRLRTYLERRATFTEEDFAFLEPLFLPRAFRAGEFFQRAGDAVTHGAFVATGCLRKYIIDAKGKEHIVQFAPENWWVGEGPGVAPGTLAQYSIDAIEDSTLLLFDAASHQRAIQHIPAYAAGLSRRSAAACRGKGAADRGRAQRVGRRPLRGVPQTISIHRAARSSIHARVVSWRLAGDAQSHPEEPIAQVDVKCRPGPRPAAGWMKALAQLP